MMTRNPSTAERAAGHVAVAGPGAERVTRLVLTHHRVIWRSMRRFGVVASEVDDACQRVFMIATRRLADIDPGAERAFLLRTALRVAKDFRRSRQRRRVDDGVEPTELVDSAESPEELADLKRARALLDAALEVMPMQLRTVFVLFELEQLKMHEIAEVLAIPAGTVASRLRSARQVFRSAVQRLTSLPGKRASGGKP